MYCTQVCCVCICTSYHMATRAPASLVPIPAFPLTKWPQKGWSGIFGPISCFSPFQIIITNQIAAWSHIYQNHMWNLLVLNWKSPPAGRHRWKNRNEAPQRCCKAFVKYLCRCTTWSQMWNIHSINKNVYTWDSSLPGSHMFLRCARDQAAIWLVRIWLAKIIWDGEN